jgi:hypothetical protein
MNEEEARSIATYGDLNQFADALRAVVEEAPADPEPASVKKAAGRRNSGRRA